MSSGRGDDSCQNAPVILHGQQNEKKTQGSEIELNHQAGLSANTRSISKSEAVPMGATSSNRRVVTVTNDSPTGLIDVSADVVQRLRSGLPSNAAGSESQPKQGGERGGPTSSRTPPVPPSTMYQDELPYTTMQVRQEKERELRENDVYWTKRLKALEANVNQTNTVLEKEYADAVADVKKRFATSAVQQQLPPCQDLKAKVIACYRKFPHETLRCADEVKQFTDCVNLHRIQLLQQRTAEEQPKQ